MRHNDERGQATVELAMAIPLLTILFLLLVQVGVVMLDQLAVTQAANQAARAAAVDPSPGAAAVAAGRSTRLDGGRLYVSVGPRPGPDGMVRVTVGYRARVVFPVTGVVLFQPQLTADAAMRVEGGASSK